MTGTAGPERHAVVEPDLRLVQHELVRVGLEPEGREVQPGELGGGQRRGGGRKPKLSSAEDKLLFILVYAKTYPLKVVQGEMFGMSQRTTSQWT